MVSSVRNDYIDVLRGLSIIFVLLLHFALAFGLRNSPLSVLPQQFFTGILSGNYGVTIFFVISGFLITSHSLRRWDELRRIDLYAFYILRASRILPPLVLALVIIVVLGLFDLQYFSNTDNNQNLPQSFFVIALLSLLTFWHNILMQSVGYFNYCLNIYWSLSVEEVFYLLLPILCVVLKFDRLLLIVVILLVGYGPIYRYEHLDNEIFYMYAYQACFDAIALGCLSAWFANNYDVSSKIAKGMIVLSMFSIFLIYFIGIQGNEVWGFTLIAFFSGLFLFASTSGGRFSQKLLNFTYLLRWFGSHSYEIYLFHIIVLGVMRQFFSKDHVSYEMRLPLLMLFFVVTSVIASIVANRISIPFGDFYRRKYIKFGNNDIDYNK